MKKTTLRMTSLALAAMFVLGSVGLSQARGHGGWHDGWDGGMRHEMNMSPEQQGKASEIFESHYKKMDAVRQSLITKRAELQAQMTSASPDKGKIESLSKEIGELRGKMLAARTDLRTQLDKEGLPGAYGMGYGMNGMGGGMGGMHHGGRGMGHGGMGGMGGMGGCGR